MGGPYGTVHLKPSHIYRRWQKPEPFCGESFAPEEGETRHVAWAHGKDQVRPAYG